MTLRPRTLQALVHDLLLHAIDASPRGSEVRVTIESGPKPKLVVDDSGSALAGPSRRALVDLEIEAATLTEATSGRKALVFEFRAAELPSVNPKVRPA